MNKRGRFSEVVFVSFLLALQIMFVPAAIQYTAPQTLFPYLLQNGYRLYTDIAAQYMPGYVWLQTALAFIIPEPLLRVQFFGLALIIVNTLLLYAIARRNFGRGAACAALLYGLIWQAYYSTTPLYFEAVIGFLVLLAYLLIQRPLLVGLLLSSAVLMKQQTIIIALCFGAYYLWQSVSQQALQSLSLPHSLRSAIVWMKWFTGS